MKNLVLVARLLLGAPLILFGLNQFFGFLDAQMPAHPPRAQAFLDALTATGYMDPLRAGTEIVCGVLLVFGRFVPLSLVILAPVTVNIVLFHVYLEPEPEVAGAGYVILVLHLLLAFAYRSSFTGVLNPGARPHGEH